MSAPLPSRLGRYEVTGVLGRGGMGTVYLGRDPVLDRVVAIKTLHEGADGAEDAELHARFRREMKVTAAFSHPHIVGVHDVGHQAGRVFIVMEHVDGPSLEGLVRDGEPAKESVVKVLRGVAAALDYAHDRGIVHRDVKPANVLVAPDGTPKLTDFGVAHLAGSELTRHGTSYGSPAYMSPEQATGQPVGPASDQFALGVLAYRLLTGTLPFTGETLTAVVFGILNNDPVPPHLLDPRISRAASDVLLKALAKNPERRHATCTALVEELECALQETGAAGREGAVPDGGIPTVRLQEDAVAGGRRPPGPIVGAAPASGRSKERVPRTSEKAGSRGWLAGSRTVPTRHRLKSDAWSDPTVRWGVLTAVLVVAGLAGWLATGSPGSAAGPAPPASGETTPAGDAATAEATAEESATGGREDGAVPARGADEVDDAARDRRTDGLPRGLVERSDRASEILERSADSPDGIPGRVLGDARCVAVIPNVVKVGFILAGRHGKGLVSCRVGEGWSQPVFVSLTGGSVGLQAGAQATDYVLVFVDDDAPARLTGQPVTLGADASVAAGPMGRSTDAGADVRRGAQILTYSRSRGLFAGVSLEGASLRIDRDANRQAHGRGRTVEELLRTPDREIAGQLVGFVRALTRHGS